MMDSGNRENCETREYSENRECSETREYSDNAPARLRERCAEAGLALQENAEGLTLCGNGLELRGDFTRMLPRLRPGNLQREFLVKASRIKGLGDHPFAVDATAGLGEDSILLAAAGYFVRMYEHNPVIAALLRDALRRAAEIPELKDVKAHCMESVSHVWEEVLRFENPHRYYVDLSPKLWELKNKMLEEYDI